MKTTLSLLTVLACCLLAACATTHSDNLGGETNWLVQCSDDDACDVGSCLCGVCTESCTQDSACSGKLVGSCEKISLGAGKMLCAGADDGAPVAVCLPTCGDDDACGNGFSCEQGSCVPELDKSPPSKPPEAGSMSEDPPVAVNDPPMNDPVSEHKAIWDDAQAPYHAVQTCTLGIQPPRCVRALVWNGRVTAMEERVFSSDNPFWQPIDVKSAPEPIASPFDQMFDEVRAGEVDGCIVDSVEYHPITGWVARYTTDCEGSTTGGRWLACYSAEPSPGPISASCDVVPDDAERSASDPRLAQLPAKTPGTRWSRATARLTDTKKKTAWATRSSGR